ncbi:MAG: ribonuclease D [Leptospirales bacterium]|jgi:ribonuclease D
MKRPLVLKGDLNEEIAAEFASQADLSVDCEMMGLNPWRDRLCVIQIMAERGSVALVQVDERAGAPRIKALFENPAINKIFHFARMDILFLYKRLEIDVQNIFCTKIASRLARTYTDRHGLKEVIRELTGEVIDKTNQSSDWGRDELTPDQVYYAADDVRYLFELKRKLGEILARENRADLAERCFHFLRTRRDLDLENFDMIFEH